MSEVNGAFATVVVILPSAFTGGDVRLSHRELRQVYACSATSSTDTTVLAWYAHVKQTVKPIAGGYRLALSFNLVHTAASPCPVLSPPSEAVTELCGILRSWKKSQGGNVPNKVIYLLDCQYARDQVSRSILKGKDKDIITLLDNIALQQGFHFGLAKLDYEESGPAVERGCGYARRKHYRHFGSYDDYESENEGVEMAEITSRSLTLTDLVNMDGNVIREHFEYDVDTEAIPHKFQDAVIAAGHDDQDDDDDVSHAHPHIHLSYIGLIRSR